MGRYVIKKEWITDSFRFYAYEIMSDGKENLCNASGGFTIEDCEARLREEIARKINPVPEPKIIKEIEI
jgi:hypothetical protein